MVYSYCDDTEPKIYPHLFDEYVLKTELDAALEALRLVQKYGYGVNIEKNLVVRNTADIVAQVLDDSEPLTPKNG